MTDSTPIAALAERLVNTEWDDTAEAAGMRTVVEGLGFGWTDTPDGARAATPFAAGDARIDRIADAPFDRRAEFAELAIPVLRTDGTALGHARAFRHAADAVEGVLGRAVRMGSYGTRDPYGRPGARRGDWGAPYLRWECTAGHGAMLELTAGAEGPELLLRSTSRLFAMAHHWRYEGYLLTGFTGTCEEDDEDADEYGAGTRPYIDEAGDWDDLRSALTEFLTVLPAELHALGTSLALPLYAFLEAPQRTAPLLFDLVCDGGSLLVGHYEPSAAAPARGGTPAELGWESADLLPAGAVPEVRGRRLPWRTDLAVYGWGRAEVPPARWRIDAGGPGEVRAAQVADLLVSTARAAGVGTALNLLVGTEGERHPHFELAFPGLRLRVG
ncbi:hypothetical protein [Kitasatospora sp. DSM 101779]|uniref:hypothetical protein n=1 Tax=Kitasatospora sp. DSM 101779 TaxID=2853165 RepID=UPI0021D9E217|nr:hypothetical protein [Kitasatospora sp. DSM 101779]MCU7820402.1 hypothetical protein [Kitasatospora sp. DSM 101779]